MASAQLVGVVDSMLRHIGMAVETGHCAEAVTERLKAFAGPHPIRTHSPYDLAPLNPSILLDPDPPNWQDPAGAARGR